MSQATPLKGVLSPGRPSGAGTGQAARKQPCPVDRKLGVVLEGLRRHRPVKEICREAGVSPASYYRWLPQIIEAARTGLAHPDRENQALKEYIRRLDEENARLQRQVRIFQELCVQD